MGCMGMIWGTVVLSGCRNRGRFGKDKTRGHEVTEWLAMGCGLGPRGQGVCRGQERHGSLLRPFVISTELQPRLGEPLFLRLPVSWQLCLCRHVPRRVRWSFARLSSFPRRFSPPAASPGFIFCAARLPNKYNYIIVTGEPSNSGITCISKLSVVVLI